MNEQTTPPQRPTSTELIRSVVHGRLSPDRSEPHVIFIPHNLSRMMKDQLEAENKTIHQFVTQVCMDYLKLKDKEKEELEKYVNFSEMQLFEVKDENIIAKY